MNSKGSLNDSLDGSFIEENDPRRLTEEIYKYLIDKTHFSRNQIRQFHGSFIKDFPSGQLNRKQFFQIYQKTDADIIPNAFCDHIFRAFDANGNGSICFTEFLVGVSMPKAPNSKKDLTNKLEWLFKIFDINGDGLIDKIEVQVVIDSYYKLLDHNTDTINLKVQSHIHANEIFEKLDIDKKMFITREEFTNSCIEDYKLLNLFAPSYSKKL